MRTRKDHYPKAGPLGGTLVRRAIALLRSAGLALPLKDSHILIAVSGGPDSVALARLVVRYGRRIAPRGALRLLHFNHAWRAEGSKGDERFVKALAKKWKLPLEVVKLPTPADTYKKGDSWEAQARNLRQPVYAKWANQGAKILTAHQADDLAETVLWRLMTAGGAAALGGIAVTSGAELRPLLTTRKKELLAFLREEGLEWRDDESNRDERFLRARLRAKILPELEKIFPLAVRRLMELALTAQAIGRDSGAPRRPGWTDSDSTPSSLLRGLGIRIRSSHHERLKRWMAEGFSAGSRGPREVHLDGGWTLRMGERRLILERNRQPGESKWAEMAAFTRSRPPC